MTDLLALLLGNPEWLVGGAVVAYLWRNYAAKMLAQGKLDKVRWLVRIPVIGVLLAALLVGLLAHRRTRRATITVLLCLGAAVFLAICWLAPGLAVRIALAPLVALGMLAFWPWGAGGFLWRWLDGAALTPANIKAALERDRQRRILAEAVRRSAGGLTVLGADPIVDGTATVRVGIPAGASPHALDGARDTPVHAVNVIAAESGADLTAVDARIQPAADGVTVHIDTTPRRLPQRVDWPGAQQ